MKHHWWSMGLNGCAALVNLLLIIGSIRNGSWLWIANAAALMLSTGMVFWSWGNMKKTMREEKERVVDILSGRFG
jgi:hypothetical protein